MQINSDQLQNIEHKIAFGIGTALVTYANCQPSNNYTIPMDVLGGLLISWSGIKSHKLNETVTPTTLTSPNQTK